MRFNYFLVSLCVTTTALFAAPTNNNLEKQYSRAFAKYQFNPSSHEATINLALAAYAIGEYEQALILVKAILEEDEQYAKALLLYGDIALQQKDRKEAYARYNAVLTYHPDSDEAEIAEKNIAIMKRAEDPTQERLSFIFSPGVDSNPYYMEKNEYMADFLTLIACSNQGQSCSFLENFADDTNAYVDLGLGKNYLYDFGSLGGFYLLGGWNLDMRNYLNTSDAGYLDASFHWGLGLVNNTGNYQFKMKVGKVFNKLSPTPDTIPGFNYDTFDITPEYKYRFQSGSILGFALHFYEHNTGNSDFIYYDQNSSNSTNVEYRRSVDEFSITYETTLFDNPLSIRFFSADQFNNDHYDNYYYYIRVPYREYKFGGLEISYTHTLENHRSFYIHAKTTEKNFKDTYDKSITIPNNYNYDDDPYGIMRLDNSFDLTLEWQNHSHEMSTNIIGYNFYSNTSNYQPMQFNKHRLYYTYYWFP